MRPHQATTTNNTQTTKATTPKPKPNQQRPSNNTQTKTKFTTQVNNTISKKVNPKSTHQIPMFSPKATLENQP